MTRRWATVWVEDGEEFARLHNALDAIGLADRLDVADHVPEVITHYAPPRWRRGDDPCPRCGAVGTERCRSVNDRPCRDHEGRRRP